ncbi:hypothetical protein CRE_31446 [Caenorhabditis remanei]|uniref:tRNA-splicing endonuclease subunit Sen54 N-terminal domain-containing protein n=1 Tax=Caenorhabditis remanei TaxID=31234 RepID=E3N5Y3_CAERE|nr:hypothetical protein CRE_31446 [Caenorhabditis remanei]
MESSEEKVRRKTIEIKYLPDSPTLKVTKVSGKHLESMGIPTRGGYELYPEEAVYLMETGSGTICTPSGTEMSLLESFSILESNSVSMSKYEIYKQIKLLGLVVLRPRYPFFEWEIEVLELIFGSRITTINFERIRHVEKAVSQKFAEKTFEMLVEMNKVPEEGVPNRDSFPSLMNRSGQFSMKMKVLHNDPSLVNFLPPALKNFPTKEVLQNIKPPTLRPQSCRPSYRPIPNSHVTNWTEFRFQQEKIRQTSVLQRFRK